MASLGSVSIADKKSEFGGGGAFLLGQASEVSEVVQLHDKIEVEVRSGNPYVVARGLDIQTSSLAFDLSHEAAQNGLDILSITGKADLSIRNATDDCLLWWREGKEQILRIVCVAHLRGRVSGIAVMVDQHGNEIPNAPARKLVHHESLRYFRLSQVTDDLFDAYRNLWLSFELLLSATLPIKNREKEGKWLKRALQYLVVTLPVSNAFKELAPNIEENLFKELYEDVRCKLFHAKDTKARLLPHRDHDRRVVSAGLSKLTRLVLLLSEHTLNARRLGSWMNPSIFDDSNRLLLSQSEMLISDTDCPLRKGEMFTDDEYNTAVSFNCQYAPTLSELGRQCALGSIRVDRIHHMSKVSRVALKTKNRLSLVMAPDAKLEHDSVDIIEVQMGFQFMDLGQPRRLFNA